MSSELYPPPRNLPLSWSQGYSYYHLAWTNPRTNHESPHQRTGNCPLCQLPYVYNHIAWCRGLTNGYTCHCHKETPPHEPDPSKADTTTIETPLPLTTVQQLDEFYPDKASYLSFRTKVINEPSFITFNYAYYSHWSLKHQIQMTEELLSSLKTMDKTHITMAEAALLRMCKGPLGNKIFSKTTTVWEDRFEKTTTTYLHDIYPHQKWRNTYPQRKVSFLTPQGTGSSTSYRSWQNLIIIDSPPTSSKQHSTPFSQNTCFKCQSSQHAVIYCPSYKCWCWNILGISLMFLKIMMTMMITYLLTQITTYLVNAESSTNR